MVSNATKNEKKSRGRPKTAFVSKKPQVKQKGPWRPKKVVNIEVPQIPTISNRKLTSQEDNKKKDAFILAMFLFSLCVFTASLYLSNKKQNMEDNNDIGPIPQTEEQISEETPITQEPLTIENTDTVENSGTSQIIEEPQNWISTANILLSSFYNAFNQNTMKTVYANIDSRLRNTKLFNVYFSKTRIQRFLRNITDNAVQVTQIEDKDWIITYKINYSLQNWDTFEEIREMWTIEKDTPQIGKIRCINTGCSTLPFFNPGKYNLK